MSAAQSLTPPSARLPERNDGASAVFTVGERFGSFAELEERITRFSAANSVQLWKRDARTIEAAKKRAGNIASKMPAALKYYQVRFCCIHGGMKFVSSSTGARKSSTFKKDCEFNIYVAANKEGSHLVVRSVNFQHNHPVAPQLSRQLPQQTPLPPDPRPKARPTLKRKANEMLVRDQMQQERGKAVLC